MRQQPKHKYHHIAAHKSADAIPVANLPDLMVHISGAGYYVRWEQFGRYAELVIAFLGRLKTGTYPSEIRLDSPGRELLVLAGKPTAHVSANHAKVGTTARQRAPRNR